MITIGADRDDPRQWVKAAYAVIDAIQRGHTGTHGKLPNRAELARTLGIHQQTVARAYQELIALGIIHLVPGHGYSPPARPSSDRNRDLGAWLSRQREGHSWTRAQIARRIIRAGLRRRRHDHAQHRARGRCIARWEAGTTAPSGRYIPNYCQVSAFAMIGPGATGTGYPASLASVPRDAAIAANWSNAACRSSTISAAINSGAGRLPVSSSDSSRSQKMSSEALSLETNSS